MLWARILHCMQGVIERLYICIEKSRKVILGWGYLTQCSNLEHSPSGAADETLLEEGVMWTSRSCKVSSKALDSALEGEAKLKVKKSAGH